MNKLNDNPYVKNALSFIIAGIVLISVYFTFQNIQWVSEALSKFISIVEPFIYAIALAFLMNPLVYWFENRVLIAFKWKKKTKHVLAVVLSFVVMIEVIVLFFAFIIPQLVDSVTSISQHFPSYIQSFNTYVLPYIREYFNNTAWLTDLLNSSSDIVSQGLSLLQQYLPNVLDLSLKVSKTILNLVLALVLALYLLFDQVMFIRQFKRFMTAFFGKKVTDAFMSTANLTSFMIHKFILGKALNSLIMGVLCYITMLVLGIDYPVFMSALFGVTNMIPFFGPFIGGAVGVFILFLENPTHALWFLIIVLVLQNLEGSVLSPLLIGDTMGLPGVWVMFAILVGGGYFGILGMFLGVPVFAVIYLVIKQVVDHRLSDKQTELEE